MALRPKPIDPRGPRVNQGVLAAVLLVGFALDIAVVAPVFGVVLLLGAAFGPRANPVMRLWAEFVLPQLGPPDELEDPRPPRFAAWIGVVFLAGATAAFAAGATGFGWALVLVVAALAGLASATGVCVGCQLYLLLARRRGVELVA